MENNFNFFDPFGVQKYWENYVKTVEEISMGVVRQTADAIARSEMLEAYSKKLEYEREVIEKVITKMRNCVEFDKTNIRHIDTPMEKTGGDIVLSAFRPDGGQHVLLGDFTGHGLPAAIAGPNILRTFYAMTKKGYCMDKIFEEIGGKLNRYLPTGIFMASSFLDLDKTRTQLRVWNCSSPSVMIFREGKFLQKVESTHLPLGILKLDPAKDHSVVQVQKGDRIYAVSDGVTEATCKNGRMFGEDRLIPLLEEIISENEDLRLISATVEEWRGFADQQDDITMVEILV